MIMQSKAYVHIRSSKTLRYLLVGAKQCFFFFIWYTFYSVLRDSHVNVNIPRSLSLLRFQSGSLTKKSFNVTECILLYCSAIGNSFIMESI